MFSIISKLLHREVVFEDIVTIIILKILYLCPEYVCACMYVCVHTCAGVSRGQKRAPDPQELE